MLMKEAIQRTSKASLIIEYWMKWDLGGHLTIEDLDNFMCLCLSSLKSG